MDHYKELGVHRTASKGEIKDAFRKLALLYHPDRHSHSPSSVCDTATFKFKRISEAYDVLSDDRKRADYNLRSSSSNSSSFRSRGSYGYRNDYSYDYSSRGRGFNGGAASASSAFESAVRFFIMRAFRLNLAIAGALCAGALVMDRSREVLWNMQNSGKSFEDAMESIEKAKAQRYP